MQVQILMEHEFFYCVDGLNDAYLLTDGYLFLRESVSSHALRISLLIRNYRFCVFVLHTL